MAAVGLAAVALENGYVNTMMMGAENLNARHFELGQHVGFVDLMENIRAEVPVTPARWYVLRVHPNREQVVMRDLRRRHMSCYLPLYPNYVPVGRRRPGAKDKRPKRLVMTPLFPGLIFIPDFEANAEKFRSIDGTAGFLKFGAHAAFARADMMRTIRIFEAAANVPRSQRRVVKPAHKLGDTVMLRDGVFEGWTGRIDRLDAKGRLRILIDCLKRGVSVEADETQIVPV